ncbi:protein app1 [Ixodes scapularis]
MQAARLAIPVIIENTEVRPRVPKKQKRDGPKVPNSGKGKGPQPAKPEERMNPLQSQLEEENAALRAELVVMQGEFLVERQLTRRLQEALLDRIDLLVTRPAVLPGVEIIPEASCFSDSFVETTGDSASPTPSVLVPPYLAQPPLVPPLALAPEAPVPQALAPPVLPQPVPLRPILPPLVPPQLASAEQAPVPKALPPPVLPQPVLPQPVLAPQAPAPPLLEPPVLADPEIEVQEQVPAAPPAQEEPVAIKTIKKSKIETEQDSLRIRREIQIMSSIQHPYIIHIYEVFENKDKIVLVMQYASGGELYDYVSERKELSSDEARRIFRQVASAVYYCHKTQGARDATVTSNSESVCRLYEVGRHREEDDDEDADDEESDNIGEEESDDDDDDDDMESDHGNEDDNDEDEFSISDVSEGDDDSDSDEDQVLFALNDF